MGLKIYLDDKASEAVSHMVGQIKTENPGCSINGSDLSSWVLSHFAAAHFEKFKGRIASHHFNPKAYLRSRIKDIDSAERLEEVLSEVRAKLKNSKAPTKSGDDSVMPDEK
jgi:hypothetical protein